MASDAWIFCDPCIRGRIGINIIGRRLCLVIRNVLVPQHDARLRINDNVVRIDRTPNQYAPRRNCNAGLGREIHFFRRSCPVAAAENRFRSFDSASFSVTSVRSEFVLDMLSRNSGPHPQDCGNRVKAVPNRVPVQGC